MLVLKDEMGCMARAVQPSSKQVVIPEVLLMFGMAKGIKSAVKVEMAVAKEEMEAVDI